MANNTTSSTNPSDASLRERLASLETENMFNKETLGEISTTLKEVVKTQHILANQKDEIEKVVRIADNNQTRINSLENKMALTDAASLAMHEDIDNLKKTIKLIDEKADKNHRFVSSLTKFLTVIMLPLIIGGLVELFKIYVA